MKFQERRGARARLAFAAALALLILGSALEGLPAGQQPPKNSGKLLRVLFIGNSFTYFNNMPAILRALAPQVETRMIAQGGLSLEDHWNNAETRKAVEEGKWDFVVLQEQSTLGETFVVNGLARLQGDRTFRTYAEKWIRAIQATSARPVLMMHWKGKEAPDRDREFLDYTISKAGSEWGAMLAPVSLAWQAAERRGVALYASDGRHPSPAGSYLEACVMYATLLGKNPVGLSANARGPEIEQNDGNALGGNVELVKLSDADARVLQESAWKGHQELASGKTQFAVPEPLQIPKLGKGESFIAEMLEGTWRGPLGVYPFPATLELHFAQKDGALSVQGLVSFGGRPEDIRFTDENVELGANEITFKDPKGPNEGVVRYKAVLRGGELRGIAEILITRYPVYLIGEWKAKPAK